MHDLDCHVLHLVSGGQNFSSFYGRDNSLESTKLWAVMGAGLITVAATVIIVSKSNANIPIPHSSYPALFLLGVVPGAMVGLAIKGLIDLSFNNSV